MIAFISLLYGKCVAFFERGRDRSQAVAVPDAPAQIATIPYYLILATNLSHLLKHWGMNSRRLEK